MVNDSSPKRIRNTLVQDTYIYGSWDILLRIFPSVFPLEDIDYINLNYESEIEDTVVFENLQALIVRFFKEQLQSDMEKIKENKNLPVSDCSLYIPPPNSPFDRKYMVTKEICKEMNLTNEQLQKKFVKPIKEHIEKGYIFPLTTLRKNMLVPPIIYRNVMTQQSNSRAKNELKQLVKMYKKNRKRMENVL